MAAVSLHILALVAITGGVAASLTRPLPPLQNLPAPFWTGTWNVATDTLVNQRSHHTATLLPSGQVMIAGGDTKLNAPAELYDPVTDSWTASAPMNAGRFGHTATLLLNGEVLVTGGRSARGPGDHSLQSVEIYNPNTKRWANPPNAIAVPRYGHTSTLLENGKVLVTGGHIHSRMAELYDPETQSWSDAGAMSINRRYHTATLLADGRVLVVGGETRHDQTGLDITSNSAEIYDPWTNSWVYAESTMLGERKSHVASLLPNGKVLVAGGTADSGASVASAELYDPESDTWSRTIWMSADRADFTATTLKDGRIFVVGGCGSACHAPVEFYDPQFQTWKRVQDLNTTRRSHTATLLPDGRMLVAGGTCDCPGEANNSLRAEVLAPAPRLQFPWPTNVADGAIVWYLSHGPYCNSDSVRCASNVVRYAINFMPPRLPGEDGCAPERQTRSWVTAAADGEIRYASNNLVEIHHGFGFRTGYYHLVDLQVSPGDQVRDGQKLGRPSCESSDKFGGTATEVQVRFYTCQMAPSPNVNQDFCGPVDAGEHVRPIDGLVLSGWTVTARSSNHMGTLLKLGEKSRRTIPQQCGVDDGCRTNSKKPIRNDMPLQLLINASFEDAKGWVAQEATFVRSDDIPAHSGRYSGQFVTTTKRDIATRQVVSGVTEGNVYFVQGWLNVQLTANAFAFSIRLRWQDTENTPIRTDVVADIVSDTAGQWNNVGSATEGCVAPTGATNAVVIMRVQGLDVEVYVDDFLFYAK